MHWCFSSEKWIIIPKQRDNCQGELNLYQALGQRRWVKKRAGKVKGGLRGPTLLSSAFLSLTFPHKLRAQEKHTGLTFPLKPWKCPWQVLLSGDLIISELKSSFRTRKIDNEEKKKKCFHQCWQKTCQAKCFKEILLVINNHTYMLPHPHHHLHQLLASLLWLTSWKLWSYSLVECELTEESMVYEWRHQILKWYEYKKLWSENRLNG